MSVTIEQDLSLSEVLESFSGGPQTGVFTDGSSRPNPGPGGWGVVVVREGKIVHQDHGHEKDTTNNRMELTALIAGFSFISPEDEIEIFTDSELCVNSMTKWAASWKKNGWKRKSGPIANLDLVQKLYELYVARPKAKLKWIKAHNGWLWNEYADSLSTAWAREVL
jgi:ribonuclease HI